MELKTLDGIGTAEITKVFNSSFADYFIPFKLTPEQMETKMKADKVNLGLSVGAFDDGALAGFILHGLDSIGNKKLLYNGGTGVLPKARGQGLTQSMYRFILPYLMEKGIHKLQLEVISKNIQAIRSYEKSGFKISRELYCYTGKVNATRVNKKLVIKALDHYPWNVLDTFKDTQPTWQNSNKVLEGSNTNEILGAYLNTQLVGYASFNSLSSRLQQLAEHKNFRRKGIATTLVMELQEKYGNAMAAINVDTKDRGMNAFLQQIGLNLHLTQLEMELYLS